MKNLDLANLTSAATRRRRVVAVAIAFVVASGCSNDHTSPKGEITLSSITIDSGAMVIERGRAVTLTATVRDSRLQVITVPLVWRSSNERVAMFKNDNLAARDTGTTLITASSLGVTSVAVPVVVSWLGAAKLATLSWTAPTAVSPGSAVNDSIRVLVTNLAGQPVANARVAFAAVGRGAVSPATDTTGPNGVAATRWVTGSDVGPNVLTATVIGDDDVPLAWVTDNALRLTVTTYHALTALDGDAQTALLLSPLPVQPHVRLVDQTGKPRAGVPVSFDASGGGRVSAASMSTDANGVASPGVWTLGETVGNQTLTATVESASLALHATATGTAIHYSAESLTGGASVSCARRSDTRVDCWGEAPKVGDGTPFNRSKPTSTSGDIHFNSLVAGSTHVCGIDASETLYCWGVNALVDTSGRVLQAVTPTPMPGDIPWGIVAPGGAHTCAISTNGTAYCWGDNSFGQLGDGGSTLRFVPQPVSGGFHFASATAGSDFTCGLSDSGLSYCWGHNQSGQLGDGSTLSRPTPTATVGGLSFVALGAGQAWSCGLTSAGTVHCWGALPGVAGAQTTPRAYTTPLRFVSLTVGGAHACALSATGEAYCWGDNSWGQLGDGTRTTRADPTPITGGMRFKSIGAGATHTCGITVAGEVACWGLNRAGEVGDDLVTVRTLPHFLIIDVRP